MDCDCCFDCGCCCWNECWDVDVGLACFSWPDPWLKRRRPVAQGMLKTSVCSSSKSVDDCSFSLVVSAASSFDQFLVFVSSCQFLGILRGRQLRESQEWNRWLLRTLRGEQNRIRNKSLSSFFRMNRCCRVVVYACVVSFCSQWTSEVAVRRLCEDYERLCEGERMTKIQDPKIARCRSTTTSKRNEDEQVTQSTKCRSRSFLMKVSWEEIERLLYYNW